MVKREKKAGWFLIHKVEKSREGFLLETWMDQSRLKASSILNKHKLGKLHISGTEKNMA